MLLSIRIVRKSPAKLKAAAASQGLVVSFILLASQYCKTLQHQQDRTGNNAECSNNSAGTADRAFYPLLGDSLVPCLFFRGRVGGSNRFEVGLRDRFSRSKKDLALPWEVASLLVRASLLSTSLLSLSLAKVIEMVCSCTVKHLF